MVHIAISIFVVILVCYRGAWRQWKQYHPTILFFGLMELEYNLITSIKSYYLWRLTSNIPISRFFIVNLYVVIIFPCTVLLYLSKFPQGFKKQIVYVLQWIAIYTFIEWIGNLFQGISYFNEWNIWKSLIFNIILFSGLILHHKKPLVAYIVFILVTILGIWALKILI